MKETNLYFYYKGNEVIYNFRINQHRQKHGETNWMYPNPSCVAVNRKWQIDLVSVCCSAEDHVLLKSGWCRGLKT